MDVRGILQKIDDDAREAASAALADAQRRAEEMKAASEAQMQRQLEQMDARIRTDAAEAESRMLRMAELEDKKARLAVKRQVMDETFAMALEQMRALPKEQKRAFFLSQLLSAAHGGETVCIGVEARAWYDEGFLQEANAALEKQGRLASLCAGEDISGCGFELRQDGAAVNCTLESLVESRRMALEGDVARALFSE